MQPHGSSDRLRNFRPATLPIALLALFVASAVAGIVPGVARSTQEAGAAPAQDEREFKNNIPGHVPIKVKVKNEKSFRDKGNKKWLRELEIEVKNTGDKPIYYVYVVLTLPEIVRGGSPLGYQITYGRRDFWLIDTEVTPEDVPILPGETVTLRVPEADMKGYEVGRELDKRNDPQKVELDLQAVNFGDGTGLYYMNGSTMRRSPKKVSANESGPRQRAVSEGAAPPGSAAQRGCSPRPATFSRVNFFAPIKLTPLRGSPPPRDLYGCQNSSTCFYVKNGVISCPCDPPGDLREEIVAATGADAGARCMHTGSRTVECLTQFNGVQYCQFTVSTGASCAMGDPTPTPTPTPLPDPLPPPDPCYPPPLDTTCIPGTILDHRGFCCPGLGGGGEQCLETLYFECGDIIPETSCPYTVGGYGSCYSPVLIDTAGDGFALTGAAGGVRFDIDGNPDRVREQVAWTVADSDDAWLALDRNGNGAIDSGRELFGNLTTQPASAAGNGFAALAQYDRAENGGNADGVIDGADAVFSYLRLWQDANRDGVSQAGELHALPALDVSRLHLSYHESKRVDAHGNEFRYRAKVDDARGAKAGRWAWDVFLKVAP